MARKLAVLAVELSNFSGSLSPPIPSVAFHIYIFIWVSWVESIQKRPKPASWPSDPVANIHHSQWFQPVLPYPLQPMDPIALIPREGLVKLDSTVEFSGLVCLI